MSRPQKLTLDFFLHDVHAVSDRKIRRLMRKHGCYGYTSYFVLLEKCCLEPGMKLDLSDPEEAELTAETIMVRDCQHLYAIVQFCADIGLFNKQLWESERVVFSDALHSQRERNEYSYGKHRNAVYKRDGGQCVYCGSTENLSLDHVIPFSRGGSDNPENLVTCCKSCNSSKGAKTPSEWIGGHQ